VKQAEAQLEKKKVALKDLTLVAPSDGLVVQVNGNVGELPSDPFIVLDNSTTGTMEVLAQVSESDIGKVKEGLSATFTTSTYSDKTFTGTVTLVYPEATTNSNVTTYDVLLSVDNKEGLLKSGMTMNVKIEIGTHKDVLYVTPAALKSQNGKDGVYLATENAPNGRGYQFQPVTIGYYSSERVEITEGLKEGDEVVLTLSSGTSNTSRTQQMGGMPGMGGVPGMGGGGNARGNR
jgi:HlyD family secretion protein